MGNTFYRYLHPGFINHINDKCAWWIKAMELVQNHEIDVAMRNGYLNFYRYGQSIAKITWQLRKKLPVAITHKKYLGKDSASYARLNPQELFLDPSRLKMVMENAESYLYPEKKGCHTITVNHTELLVDMEIGLPGLTSRFDMVAALPDKDGIRLTFYEAKHSENTCLRSNKDPKVLAQLIKYKYDIQNEQEHIIKGYRNAVVVAKNIETRSGCLQALATLSLTNIQIDVQPRLVVFMPEQGNRPLEQQWQRVLLENNVRLIYAASPNDIALQ